PDPRPRHLPRPPLSRRLRTITVQSSNNGRCLRTHPVGAFLRAPHGHGYAWCVSPTTHVGRRIPRRQPVAFDSVPAGLSRAVVIQLSPSGERFGSEYLGVHSCTPRCEPATHPA